MLLILAGTALGTIWLYDDPAFLQLNSPAQDATFNPGKISPFEIIDAPYFPLLRNGTSDTVQIFDNRNSTSSPIQVTFGGNLENNLNYAMTKSSIRIGQKGTWNSLNVPGARV
jgi:hypothetical protein